jgi:hypothetical protein
MRWLWRPLELAWWFRWTVAGRAVRDGWRGLPAAEQIRHMVTPAGDLDEVRRRLENLDGAGRGPDHNGAGEGSKTDDFDRALTALDGALRLRGGAPDSLDRNQRVRLLHLVGELIGARRGLGVEGGDGRPSGAPPAPPRPEPAIDDLTLYEANIVDLAHLEMSPIRLRWERVRHRLEADANRIRHHLADLLRSYAAQHRLHREKGYRSPHPMIPMSLYLVMMGFFGLAEIPFNIEAFRILDFGPEERWLIAAGPSLAILFLAHLSGTKVRQWPSRASLRPVLVVGSSAVALFATLIAMGLLRARYVEATTREAVDGWLVTELLLINVVFLVAGTFAAYAAHDPDRDLERICTEKKRLRKQVDAVWRQWNRVVGEYDTARGVAIEELRRVRKNAIAAIGEYRDMNARARGGMTLPPSFAQRLDDRFFEPVDVGPELDKTPRSLQEILDAIAAEDREASVPLAHAGAGAESPAGPSGAPTMAPRDTRPAQDPAETVAVGRNGA